ncbi:MAG TPA: TonB-dependent receptor [Bryobacteraceae bacterium]
MTGTVQDPSGAAVAKAAVTLTATATGAERTATSNSAGQYSFSSLPVGPYQLSVVASGFGQWQTNFTLQAGQTVTVDPRLQMSAVQTRIVVSGAASQITTQGAQLSDQMTARQIHDLPLNGRDVSNLFSLTPGIEGGQNTQGAPAPRTNGMMVGSTGILVDGMSYVDRFGGGISRVQPGLDTIQEYQVQTAGSSASFDRPATIQLVTRSGTNAFHGAIFETLRDNYGGLVARAVQDGNTPAKLIRNEFGGYVGGPIVRNRAFFFYDQEFLKQRQQVFAQSAMPTAAMWGGDFSNMTDTSGDIYTLYNPYTTTASGSRAPFPNNVIPTTLLNTQVLDAFKGVTPLPTGPNASANPWIGENFQAWYPQNTDTDSITGRYDQTLFGKDSLSVRFTRSVFDYLQQGGHYGYPPPGQSNSTGTSARNSAVYNITAHYTHIFSPSLLNDFQLGALRSANFQGTGSDDVNWDSKLGLPNPFGATGWPTVYTDAGNMFFGGGWDNDNHKAQDMTQYEIDDHVTWVTGKHTLEFGFKGKQEYNNVEELQQAQGSESFDSAWTGLYDPSANAITSFTGSGLASLEMGLPAYLSNVYNRGYFYFRQKELAAFAQDTWKVSPKLTLTLGLRWQTWTPYREKYNRLDTIDLNSLSPTSMQVVLPGNTTLADIPDFPAGVADAWATRGLTAVSANSIGYPSALTPSVWNDYAPRLGVAYRINNKTVIRGGYGVYYWPMPLSQILATMRLNAPLNLRYVNSVDDLNGANGVYALTAVPAASDRLGTNGAATVTPSAVASSAQNFLALDAHNWNNDRMQEWTFAIERELARNLVLKLVYTGNHGSNLQEDWDVDAPLSRYNYQLQTGLLAPSEAYQRQFDPNWSLHAVRHNGYSNSNSFQFILDKRFSHGLSFDFFYAYTHSMTTNDSGALSSGGGSINAVSIGSGTQGSGTSGSIPANNELLGAPNLTDAQRLRLLYTNSSQVPPQRITWTGIYQLPFGKGKKFLENAGRGLDALVGGWQIAFIGTWDGGFWMGNNASEYQFANPSLGPANRLKLNYSGQAQELWFAGDFDPTKATGVNLANLETLVPVNRGSRNIHPLGASFNNRVPQTLADGTVVQTDITDNLSWNARNYMLGPPAWDQDISIFKYFNITERVRLRMSGDFFNVFNHPTLNNPDPTTGLINLSSQPNSPRIIQVGARLEF